MNQSIISKSAIGRGYVRASWALCLLVGLAVSSQRAAAAPAWGSIFNPKDFSALGVLSRFGQVITFDTSDAGGPGRPLMYTGETPTRATTGHTIRATCRC